jgi:gamma-glutamyltranspeptidase/glutathione hydrolase
MSSSKSCKQILFLVFIGLFLCFVSTSIAENPIPGKPVEAATGMVASAHPLATQVGLEVLKKGGNAADAAVATAFALGVVEPNASGLGGGGFIMFYNAKTKRTEVINYREMAPLAATPDMYPVGPDGKPTTKDSTIGHKAVAVPGTLAGLEMALKRWGTMKLEDVMAPAIKIAEEGYTVTPTLNEMMKNYVDKLSKFPAAAEIYLKNGLPYETGEKLVLKDLAKSYRLIAKKGTDVFYKGEIADAIEKEMKAGNGLITKEDLTLYKPALLAPVQGTYRGYEIISAPPPSSGGMHIIQIMNLMEGFDMAKSGQNSPESVHRMAEAMKLVFADRSKFSGDPDFTQVPVKGLLSKEYATERRKLIIDDKVGAQVPAGDPMLFQAGAADPAAPITLAVRTLPLDYTIPYQSGGTSHSSYVDKNGNMVSLTQTINLFFGSGVVIPGYGIIMNDEMDDFVKVPGNANSIQPKKRPISSMSPSIVLKDGKPILSIGTPGANRIITAIPQILMNIIDYGMDIQQAINAPRIHCEGSDLSLESNLAKETQAALVLKGHTVKPRKPMDLFFGGAQGIIIDPKTGKLYGGADPRRDGFAAGY